MIPRALEAEILRLHHAEHWPIGTIAAQLRVHHSVVRRVLAQAGRFCRIKQFLDLKRVDFIEVNLPKFA